MAHNRNSELDSLSFEQFIPPVRILRRIGSGGFAEVYEVEHCSTGDKFALKIIDKKKLKNSNLLSRLNEEISIHRSLDSAFITKYLHSWHTSSNFFILLELAEGGDLFALWRRGKVLPIPSVRRYLAQIATTLDYLHRNEIVYRDLKLENVLLSAEGDVKLSDFGLAGRLPRGRYDLTFCGTMEYMSPEILAASFYSHSTDFWSLGVVAYSLLMGRYPYEAESNYNAMLNKVLSTRPRYAADQANVSKPVRSLLDGLMEVVPNKRIGTLDELKEHNFFKLADFDFDSLSERRFESSLQISQMDHSLIPYCNSMSRVQNKHTLID